MVIKRHQSVEQGMTDCFVDGVMASDVFAHNNLVSVDIEDSRRVDAAGAGEISLVADQTFRQFQHRCYLDANRRRGIEGRKLLPDEFDACLAAEPAAAGNRAETRGRGRLEFHALSELDVQ